MSVALLNEWLDAVRERPGLAVHATEQDTLFCVDPGDGPLLAIEWEPQAHALHLYGHPGHARWRRAPAGVAHGARVLELATTADEQRHLHLQADTGLLTLSVRRSLASLDRNAFLALVDGVLADMALWAMLASDDLTNTSSNSENYP